MKYSIAIRRHEKCIIYSDMNTMMNIFPEEIYNNFFLSNLIVGFSILLFRHLDIYYVP